MHDETSRLQEGADYLKAHGWNDPALVLVLVTMNGCVCHYRCLLLQLHRAAGPLQRAGFLLVLECKGAAFNGRV